MVKSETNSPNSKIGRSLPKSRAAANGEPKQKATLESMFGKIARKRRLSPEALAKFEKISDSDIRYWLLERSLPESEIRGRKKPAEGILEEKRHVRKGRTLRKSFERPRPDLPANAPANRTRKQIALTLPDDLIDQVNQHVKAEDMDRSRFIEAAIREALKLKPI